MENTMTVKALIEMLSNYDGNLIVRLTGGECEHGEWAQLEVGTVYGEFPNTEFSGEPIWIAD